MSVSGTLRLSAPPNISDTLLTPLVTAFQASYPNVRVQILIAERFVDHIADGVDVAFRLGALKDSSLVARKVLTYRHQLVASPDYLKSCKAPQRPQDLLCHRLIAFSYWRPESHWTFARVDGRDQETLTFQPYLSMNDFSGLTPALVAGRGIGDLLPLVQPELMRDGRLVEVMPEWRFPSQDLSSFTSAIGTCRERFDCSRSLRRAWRRRCFKIFRHKRHKRDQIADIE
ncbi:MAG: substrate binding domain-containing protein [Xanthobacteraceae bacterium]